MEPGLLKSGSEIHLHAKGMLKYSIRSLVYIVQLSSVQVQGQIRIQQPNLTVAERTFFFFPDVARCWWKFLL